ncbi:nucleotidyltransferase [Streptomyces bambusae]|uniref:nucleotidyltransferase n=1 Tax=Streptomyces bambusae TaxID=1550616 RepID=UPI001CFCE22A|nr:nucleotidyltransferase [Streptomyces bambusae]MCB5166084.1 nucleotidyltransferase [Streptomyces bambusae]
MEHEPRWVERRGALGRVAAGDRPAVAAARARTAEAFGRRLHSAYLYGPVPLGRPGPLGLLAVLHAGPGPQDRATGQALADALRAEVPGGAAVLLYGKEAVLAEEERDGLGWFTACRCVPLLGEDLAEHLPRYRADAGLRAALPYWRELPPTAALSRAVARRLVRAAFTLVPAGVGWTDDLAEAAEAFARCRPERAGQVRAAAAAALDPAGDPSALPRWTDDLGPWLAAACEEQAAAGQDGHLGSDRP